MGGRGASSGRSVKVRSEKYKYRMNLQFFAKSEKYEQYILPKKEYGMVMSQINTHVTKEEKRKKIFKKRIRNHVYTVYNRYFYDPDNAFDNWVIIGKDEIE